MVILGDLLFASMEVNKKLYLSLTFLLEISLIKKKKKTLLGSSFHYSKGKFLFLEYEVCTSD